MRDTKEKPTYNHGMAPSYWRYCWNTLPYGVTQLPRSDDLNNLPERWVLLEREIWQEFLNSISNIQQNKILDLGCGAGKLIQFFLENDALSQNITALDENQQLINWCSQVWKEVTFVCANATTIAQNEKLVHAKFNLIASHMLLNLLDDEQMFQVLHGCFNILNTDGILAIQLPSSLEKSQRYRISDQTKLVHEKTPWGLTPYYYRSELRIAELLQQAGFKIESLTNYSYQNIKKHTVHLINHLGMDSQKPKRLFIVCKKNSEVE